MKGRETGFWAELRKRVYSVALSLTGNATDADDVTQEACLRIHRNINEFRGESQLFTWVYIIVRNSYYDLCRQTKKRQDYFCLISAQVTIPDFTELVIYRALLNRLPYIHKKILLLREVYGYSYQEIAKITQTSIDSVKSRLYRARRMLLSEVSGKQ